MRNFVKLFERACWGKTRKKTFIFCFEPQNCLFLIFSDVLNRLLLRNCVVFLLWKLQKMFLCVWRKRIVCELMVAWSGIFHYLQLACESFLGGNERRTNISVLRNRECLRKLVNKEFSDKRDDEVFIRKWMRKNVRTRKFLCFKVLKLYNFWTLAKLL